MTRSHPIASGTVPLLAALLMGIATAPLADAALHGVHAAPTVTDTRGGGMGLVLTIQGREHDIRVDVARAESLRVGFDGSKPDESGHRTIAGFARRSPARTASRVLVIGGSSARDADDAAFRRARSVRQELIAAGWNGDRLVVAGWRTIGVLPVALGQIDRADVFVIVPILEDERVVSPESGDPGRAMALDSAYSRSAEVSTRRPAPVAAAPLPTGRSMPSERPLAAPMPLLPPSAAAPRPPLPTARPAPLPASKPVPPLMAAEALPARTAPAPSARVAPPLVVPRPPVPPIAAPVITSSRRGAGEVTPAVASATRRAVRPAAASTVSAGTASACGAPSIVLDDFYPGGPFRDCAGHRRVISR